MFEPERKEVNVNWRKLHSEKLNYLFSSLNIIKITKPGGCDIYSTHGSDEKCIKTFYSRG